MEGNTITAHGPLNMRLSTFSNIASIIISIAALIMSIISLFAGKNVIPDTAKSWIEDVSIHGNPLSRDYTTLYTRSEDFRDVVAIMWKIVVINDTKIPTIIEMVYADSKNLSNPDSIIGAYILPADKEPNIFRILQKKEKVTPFALDSNESRKFYVVTLKPLSDKEASRLRNKKLDSGKYSIHNLKGQDSCIDTANIHFAVKPDMETFTKQIGGYAEDRFLKKGFFKNL